MFQKYILLLFTSLILSADTTILETTQQSLNFSHSLQKRDGKRFTLFLSHQYRDNQLQIAYEKSDTRTYQPPLPSNLHVKKYFVRYRYTLNRQKVFTSVMPPSMIILQKRPIKEKFTASATVTKTILEYNTSVTMLILMYIKANFPTNPGSASLLHICITA